MFKRTLVLIALFVMMFVGGAVAQQVADDAPATKADVEKYLEVSHARNMTKQMVQAMSKPMHQMIHEQFDKDKDKLPADFEARMNRVMDDMMQGMPFDEMLTAMEPAYQRNFTHGDITALTVFYGSPAGQRILAQMPTIMAESMQDMMPIMQRYMASMQEKMMAEFKKAESAPGEK